MIRQNFLLKLGWPIFAGLLTACALLQTRLESPSVSVANLNVIAIGFFEQRYQLRLRIQNPNDFALPINGMNYHLQFNDEPFARGVSAQLTVVPAFGEKLIDVEVTSNLGTLVKQWLTLGRETGLRYSLSGSLALGNAFGKVPFNYQGEIFPERITTNRNNLQDFL
jgi:LEA14-like dessication related protein